MQPQVRIFAAGMVITLLAFLPGHAQEGVAGHLQDSPTTVSDRLQQRYASAAEKKVTDFNAKVEAATRKRIDVLIGQEKKMQGVIGKMDSAKAKSLFGYSIDSLKRFQTMIARPVSKLNRVFKGGYLPYLDSLKGSLSFFKKAQAATGQITATQDRLNGSLGSVDKLEDRLSTVSQINTYLQQRRSVLQAQVSRFPALAKPLQNFNSQTAVYQARINNYKQTLSDPDKIEKLVMAKLEQTPAFQQFFQQHSQLSGTFASPPTLIPGSVLGSMPVVNGIPSRAALQQYAKKELPALDSTDLTQIVQQKVQSTGAGAQEGGSLPSLGSIPALSSITSRVPSSGQLGNGGDATLPAGSQSGLPLGKRLEYGTNIQFAGSNNFLPATANLGLQAGYKFSSKGSFGIGISYGLGIGTGWKNIKFTNNSLGLLQYLKYKTGKSFFLQGGAEFNYITAFAGISELRNFSAWQTSALLGVGREYSVSKKIKGSILLLFDGLYREHHPPTQPLVFRIGYNL
jgi:hypothetical protein